MLKLKVQCYRCGKEVEKADAREVESVSKEKRYECFSCFKRYNPRRFKVGEELQKREYYCERCRYRFHSRNMLCPYCNKADRLVEGKISVQELL